MLFCSGDVVEGTSNCTGCIRPQLSRQTYEDGLKLAACSAVEGEQKYESFDLQPACVTIARYYPILTKAQQATLPSGKESRVPISITTRKGWRVYRWKVVAAGGWGGRKIPIHMLTHSGTYRLTPTRVHPASSAAQLHVMAQPHFHSNRLKAKHQAIRLPLSENTNQHALIDLDSLLHQLCLFRWA